MKLHKNVILLLSLLGIFPNELFGQDLPEIQTDRPDQTESPFIVPKRHFQIENGFNFEKIGSCETIYLYPSILWKYGVSDHFELRLITELTTYEVNELTTTGINPIEIGFKTSICQENGLLPTISFIGHLAIPFLASKDFQPTYFAPSFRFAMQHTLSERVSLGYNLGAEWDGETGNPAFIYSLATGFSLVGNIGMYIEVYGFAPQEGRADHRADGGFTFLVKPNLLLDVSGGIGLTDNAPDYYGSLGVSVRLPN